MGIGQDKVDIKINRIECFAEKKIPEGKYVKISLTMVEGKIEDISITGDFFIYPEEFIDTLEKDLIGLTADTNIISSKMEEYFNKYEHQVELIGINYDEIKKLILECIEKAVSQI